MIYLAQPYSDPDPEVQNLRYRKALKVCAWLMSKGKHVYSPIVHWHNAAMDHQFSTDAAFWYEHNVHMVRRADALYIYQLKGWHESVGLYGELKAAVDHGKPVHLLPVSWSNIVITNGGMLLEELTEYAKNNSERDTRRADLKRTK